MSLIPEEELKKQQGLNLAPMVDFLFLIIAVLACMALTHAFLFDSDLKLAQINESAAHNSPTDPKGILHLSLDSQGSCRWLLESALPQPTELSRLSEDVMTFRTLGLFPSSGEVKIFLHIDQHVEWGQAVNAILTARQTGLAVHPVFESQAKKK